MDAIELLTNDHDKVRELFRKFNGGGGLTGIVRRTIGSVSSQERRRAVDQVCKELETHTRIEEEIFYPAVRALRDQELNDQIKEALAEHAKVKREVTALRAARGNVDAVDDDMRQLEQDVEHHASEEEREMFPRLEKLMGDDERAELGRRMQALKRGGTRSTSGRATVKDSPARSTRARAKTTGKTAARSSGRKRKQGGAAKSVAANKRANKRVTSRKRTTVARGRARARSGRR